MVADSARTLVFPVSMLFPPFQRHYRASWRGGLPRVSVCVDVEQGIETNVVSVI